MSKYIQVSNLKILQLHPQICTDEQRANFIKSLKYIYIYFLYYFPPTKGPCAYLIYDSCKENAPKEIHLILHPQNYVLFNLSLLLKRKCCSKRQKTNIKY